MIRSIHRVSRSSAHEEEGRSVGLVAAEILALHNDGAMTLRLGGKQMVARRDASVHAAVVESAFRRRERVLAQREPSDDGESWTVLGALRTSPTPGVDFADEYVISAGRVRIDAQHEFSVVSGLASFVLRAHGYVETLADQITTRASSIHKIVGRMLHLN